MKSSEIQLQKIAVQSSAGGVEFFAINDIIYCEANGPYTYIFLVNGRKIISVRNIKEYEEMLPDSLFFRSHHSFLINLNKIKKYHKGRGGEVEMENGVRIEIAIRRRDEFFKKINL